MAGYFSRGVGALASFGAPRTGFFIFLTTILSWQMKLAGQVSSRIGALARKLPSSASD
jgi:hypothetical protein